MNNNYQNGGWYNNPNAGGKNQRWFSANGGTWTDGSDPGSGPSNAGSRSGDSSWQSMSPGVNWQDLQSKEADSIKNYTDTSNAKVDSTVSGQQTGLNTVLNDNKTQDQAFNDRFHAAPSQLRAEGDTRYNVGNLTDLTNALGTRISQLTGNTNNAGAGGFVNSDTVDKAVNLNYVPRYTDANSQLQKAQGMTDSYVTQGMTPYTTEADLLSKYHASQLTGWNDESQRQMDGILAVINNGGTLTADEWKNANALAQKQIDFEQAKMQAKAAYDQATTTAKIQAGYAGNRFAAIQPGYKVYDTQNPNPVAGTQKPLSLAGLKGYGR